MSEIIPGASHADQQPSDGQNPPDGVFKTLHELIAQAREWEQHGLPPELAAAVQSAEAAQPVEKPQIFDARPVGQVGLAGHTDIQLDPPQPELKALPNKPLRECSVADLKGLHRHQLAELIVASTYYDERTVNHAAFRDGLAYNLVLDKPDETTKSTSIVAENVRIHEPEQQGSHLHFVDIHLPHIPNGSAKTLRGGLPAIDEKLREQDLPVISWLEQRIEENVELFWRNSPEEILAQHNYGDGPMFMEHEQPHDMLAGEIRDLRELGFDFDDIVKALEPVARTMRQAIVTDHKPEVPTTGPWCVTNAAHGLPAQYTIENRTDPTQQGLTKLWKHNTSSLPFKDVQASTLDHELGKPGHPGWRMPISETSLELYKHRVVEGHYQPHYRISAARTVWAMEMGTPEQQARALEIDWNHTAEALDHAAANEDRAGMNAIFNYMMRYFPRDDAPWRQHGFPGYSYQGVTYPSLRELLSATIAQYDHIKLVIPQGYEMYRRIPLHGIDDDM
ncbi:MAG TPA: hypothetical protein VLE73_06390 [Candidatus Saccharimonadales bacterium]|nr:hypothetical protein [Candidatus Saccharimonadales bacterium]